MNTDPLEAARIRGEAQYRSLLDGCVDEVAMGLLMGIVPMSVGIRQQSGRILAFPTSVPIPHTEHSRVEWRYPVWQLVYNTTSGFYQPVPGLVETWISLGRTEAASPLTLARFLLSENSHLGGHRPIAVLRERSMLETPHYGDVMDAAYHFDEQGST